MTVNDMILEDCIMPDQPTPGKEAGFPFTGLTRVLRAIC